MNDKFDKEGSLIIPDEVKARTYLYLKDLVEIADEIRKHEEGTKRYIQLLELEIEINQKIIDVYEVYENDGIQWVKLI